MPGISMRFGAAVLALCACCATFPIASTAASPFAAEIAPGGRAAPPKALVSNYQGLWWNDPPGSEAGWGINFAHQGDVIFATWFTYNANHQPLWLAATLNRTAPGIYRGDIIVASGPAFNSPLWNTAHATETTVGTMAATFDDLDHATLAYTISGISQTKKIVRQVFASPVPTCTWNPSVLPDPADNYQDLWWKFPAGTESGWGVNFTQQGNIIFVTWFTYDALTNPLWLIAVAENQGNGVWSGPISRVTGPPFFAEPWDPADVIETIVGATTITFSGIDRAQFAYTVNGITQTKQITRQVFRSPGTICQ